MSLHEELGFRRKIENLAHEVVLEVFVTADLLAKEADRVVRPFGLTEAQFNVLMLLAYQSSAGEMDQTSLGQMLVVNRSNVTGLVDRLEQAGLVARGPDPSDRRVRLIRLTSAGREALAAAEKAYYARVDEVVADLSPADRRRLGELLGRMRTALASGTGRRSAPRAGSAT